MITTRIAALPLTDVGNALRLAESFYLEPFEEGEPGGYEVRWTASHGYLVYDGICWRSADELVMERAVGITKELEVQGLFHLKKADGMVAAGLVGADDERRLGEELYRHGRTSQGVQRIKAMVELLRSVEASIRIDVSQLDTHKHLLTFRNGTVDLRTGELVEHDPHHLITKALDVDYDPEANCPIWEQALLDICSGDEEYRDFLRVLVGYGVTGETREHKVAVLYGTGGNGKSIFLETLQAIFDPITKVTPFSTFEERRGSGATPEVAELHSARLVYASEGEAGAQMSEANLKRASGGDTLYARRIYQDPFEFRPSFLLLLATNHEPRFKGADEGLWRRILLVPFERRFTANDRDMGLADRLLTEREGIAAWTVRGSIEWYARSGQEHEGRKGSGLPPCDVVERRTAEFRANSDPLGGFLPGILVEDRGADIAVREAHKLYMAWADASGIGRPWTEKGFSVAVRERGYETVRRNSGSYIIGLRAATKAEGAAGGSLIGLTAPDPVISLSGLVNGAGA